MLDEGTTLGYDMAECSNQEDFCAEKEGIFFSNIDSEAPFMCSCTWGNTDVNAIDIYQLEDLNSSSATFKEILSHNNFLGKAILYYYPFSDT